MSAPNKAKRKNADQIAREAREVAGLPTVEGFYWGLWLRPSPGTADEKEPGNWPAIEWEVMHVVENTLDESDDEHLMVMVPGVQKWQALDAFQWGSRVLSPSDAELRANHGTRP